MFSNTDQLKYFNLPARERWLWLQDQKQYKKNYPKQQKPHGTTGRLVTEELTEKTALQPTERYFQKKHLLWLVIVSLLWGLNFGLLTMRIVLKLDVTITEIFLNMVACLICLSLLLIGSPTHRKESLK